MKICKIWDADYPWDVRVEKVVTSLTDAGHVVHLVCRNQARRAVREERGLLTIHRLPIVSSSLGWLHEVANFPFPINPVWIYKIAKVVWSIRPDLILVRDILLAPPAAILGKLFGVPVVLDLAEHYPAMLQDRLDFTPTSRMGRVIRHPQLAKLAERLSLSLVDETVVVVEESRDRLVSYGVREDRIAVVSNTPRVGRWVLEMGKRTLNTSGKSLKIVYLGILDGSRGLDLVISAVRKLKDSGRYVELTIIGSGPNFTQLCQLAEQLGVTDRVSFTGHLSLHEKDSFARVQSIMADSDIGVIPHYATEAWSATIPNKLFDYMSLGLPVIVSDAKPAARIVHEEECGEVFRDRDVADLASRIQILFDENVRRKMGQRGQAAIGRRYNWGHDGKVLIETLERVVVRS